MRQVTFGLAAIAAAACVGGARLAHAQVHRMAELNTAQIRALDRQRTAVILPGGILEEHGPYLPSYTDGYYNEHATADIIQIASAQDADRHVGGERAQCMSH